MKKTINKETTKYLKDLDDKVNQVSYTLWGSLDIPVSIRDSIKNMCEVYTISDVLDLTDFKYATNMNTESVGYCELCRKPFTKTYSYKRFCDVRCTRKCARIRNKKG